MIKKYIYLGLFWKIKYGKGLIFYVRKKKNYFYCFDVIKIQMLNTLKKINHRYFYKKKKAVRKVHVFLPDMFSNSNLF